MAAWEALGKVNFLPAITSGEGEFFNVRPAQEVECLALSHSLGKFVLEQKWDLTVPMSLAEDDYRTYSVEQDDLAMANARFCSWVVADYWFIGGSIFLLINPIIRSKDGEWESSYFDSGTIHAVRFLSWAELMIYLCINDIVGDENFLWRGRDEDPTGLSKILFD